MSLIITITPTGTAGDRYEARIDNGRLLVSSSRQPFLDGCRQLIRLGFDADEVAELRHRGSSVTSLRARIGDGAKQTVAERDRGGPYFEPWKARPSSAVTPPAAKSPRTLTDHRGRANARAGAEVLR
jgi:hypothetical protein